MTGPGFLPRDYPSIDKTLQVDGSVGVNSATMNAIAKRLTEADAERERLLALLAEAREALKALTRWHGMGHPYEATLSRLDATLAADPSAKG